MRSTVFERVARDSDLQSSHLLAALAFFLSLAVLAAPLTVAAQLDDLDDLSELDEGVVMETPFEAGIEANSWEFGFQFGYIDLGQVMFRDSSVMIDMENLGAGDFSDNSYTHFYVDSDRTERAQDFVLEEGQFTTRQLGDVIYADMEFRGEVSFAPSLFLNRTIGSHFAIENSVGMSFGDFTQSVSNLEWFGAGPGPEDDPAANNFTENEIETGSLISFQNNHALTYYIRDTGRVLPYITAGIGTQWIEIDSDYTQGFANSIAFSYGLGLRIIGDDLFSLRLDVRNFHSKMEFELDSFWRTQQNSAGDAIIEVPITHYDGEQSVGDITLLDGSVIQAVTDVFSVASDKSFAEESLSNLQFSLGFIAAF